MLATAISWAGGLAVATTRASAASPDLRVKSIDATSGGGRTRVVVVVVNGGDARAPASKVSLRYSRSRSVLTSGALLIAKRIAFGALAPGAQATRSMTFRPPRRARGRFLFACADGPKRIRERSETNNCRRSGTREASVVAPPANPPSAPATPPPPPPPPSAQANRSYAGTLTTAIRYFNFCGTPSFDEVTQVPSTITIGPPVSTAPAQPGFPAAVGGDANPIRIVLGQTSVAANMARGSISLASALRFGSTSPPIVLQYWRLELNGTALSGTLVEDHREEAAAYNLLAHAAEVVPCRPEFGFYPNQSAIAEGATLTGTVTDQSVTLRIQGSIVETTRAFAAEITATRTP